MHNARYTQALYLYLYLEDRGRCVVLRARDTKNEQQPNFDMFVVVFRPMRGQSNTTTKNKNNNKYTS